MTKPIAVVVPRCPVAGNQDVFVLDPDLPDACTEQPVLEGRHMDFSATQFFHRGDFCPTARVQTGIEHGILPSDSGGLYW